MEELMVWFQSVYSVAAEWDKKDFGAFNICFMACGMA